MDLQIQCVDSMCGHVVIISPCMFLAYIMFVDFVCPDRRQSAISMSKHVKAEAAGRRRQQAKGAMRSAQRPRIRRLPGLGGLWDLVRDRENTATTPHDSIDSMTMSYAFDSHC